MTDLEIFESFCPQVEPLSAHARAGLRLDLFGSERLSEPRPSNDVEVDAALGRGAGGEPPRSASGRRLLAVAAVSMIVVGVAGVWLAVGSRDVEAPAPALQPSSTSTDGVSELQPPESPLWYDTIRPLLPDGFDQIVLTTAQPEVVAFKAFRTGTRQLLDITITLEPGYDIKDTGEVATFSDDHGDYIESTSAVALTTPDQRRVLVRCGLSPVGGGVVGSVGLADSVRDYCGAGFDNLDLDPASRRALAATLAEEFPTDIVTSAFGQPSPRAESTALAATISDFIGEERPFAMEQADGVLRVADLSPNAGGPPITELTVINGIWPPDGDGSAFDDLFANSPLGRFYNYDDIAVALVAVDRIAFHIATTDVSQANLEQLGELLQRLIDDATANSEPTTPAIGTQPASTSAMPPTSSGPTSFPVLDALPDGLSATAYVREIADGVTTPGTEALIGRLVDGVLTDSVYIVTQATPFSTSAAVGHPATDAVVMGEPARVLDRSSIQGDHVYVLWGSGPYFLAAGADPLALLSQIAPGTISAGDAPQPAHPPQLTVRSLRDGLELIAGPQAFGQATLDATLSIGADNYDVSVSTRNKVMQMALVGTVRVTDMGGRPAWTFQSSSLTQDIAWQVDDSTYAYLKVNDGSDAADALDLAAQIRFVDFDTWTALYPPDTTTVTATTAPTDD